jgi:hypothetical protein
MEKKRNAQIVLVGNPKEKDRLQDLGKDGNARPTWNLLPEDLLVSQEC